MAAGKGGDFGTTLGNLLIPQTMAGLQAYPLRQKAIEQEQTKDSALQALLRGLQSGQIGGPQMPAIAQQKLGALAFPEQAAARAQEVIYPTAPKPMAFNKDQRGFVPDGKGGYREVIGAVPDAPKIPDILIPGVLEAEIKKAQASRAPEKPSGVGDVFKNLYGSDVPENFTPVLGPNGLPTGETRPIVGSPADPAIAEQKRVAELKTSLPKAQGAVNGALSEFDKTIGIIDEVLSPENDTGLGDVTGFGGTGFGGLFTIPGSDATRVQAKIDQLKGRAFLSGLATLKSASPNGSTGLGATSETEGKKVQDAQAALNQAQSAEDFKKALLNYRQALTEAKANIGNTFRQEYAPVFKSVGWSITKVQ